MCLEMRAQGPRRMQVSRLDISGARRDDDT